MISAIRIVNTVLLVAVFTAAPVAAEAVAVVIDAVGTVSVTATGSTHDVTRFDRLEAGTALTTGSSSKTVLAFSNGHRVEVGPETKVVVESQSVKIIDGATKDLAPVATGPAIAAIPASERPGRRSGAIRIRSGSVWGSSVENLYPRDGAAISASEAVLTFDPIPSAESYRVDIEDDMGETVFAIETRSPRVPVPEGVLRPGIEYYWRVRSAGRRSQGGQGEALFVTLEEPTDHDLRRLERELSEESTVSSILLLAEANRSLGRYREACSHLGQAETASGGERSFAGDRASFRCEAYAHLD